MALPENYGLPLLTGPSAIDWIRENIRSEVVGMRRANLPSDLTVGLEIELFLLDARGQPASHAEGQMLMDWLSCRQGWVAECLVTPEYGQMIDKLVRREQGCGTIEFKYDQHPHLFEIAMGPARDLSVLSEQLACRMTEAADGARALGLSLEAKPFLGCVAPESPLPAYRSLRWTRRQSRIRADKTPDSLSVNYAARIAAVQLHIGGLDWFHRPEWVEALYRWEPLLLFEAYRSIAPDHGSLGGLAVRRWAEYSEAFPGNVLIGFPRLDRWNLNEWTTALADVPILGDEGDLRAGGSLREWMPGLPWEEARNRFRDLQIIRPRSSGTLEFRADPMQTSVEAIARMCALRLGLACGLFESISSPLDFGNARDLWWNTVTGGVQMLPSEELLNVAGEFLRRRGLGEERLLESVAHA